MDFMNSFVSHEMVHMQAYLDNISVSAVRDLELSRSSSFNGRISSDNQ